MTTKQDLNGCYVSVPEGYALTILDKVQPISYPASFRESGYATNLAGTGHRNLPVAVEYPVSKVGIGIPGFQEQWYYRCHLFPVTLPLGNLMTTQVRQLKVWNAFLSTTNLTAIDSQTDEGITLSGPTVVPAVVEPLQELNYTVTATLQGPPTIDGYIRFNFGTFQLQTTVTGSRVVVWPFSPQQGYSEGLEWLTDVMRSKTSEQRVAMRDAPRQSFDYRYIFDDHQVSRARAMAVGWAQRQFGLPVWNEAAYVGTVQAGVTTLTVDTTAADYRAGDALLVWTSDNDFEAIVVNEIRPNEVDVALPVSKTYNGAFIMPMRYARSTEMSIIRSGNAYGKVRTQFTVVANKNLGASIGLPTYKDLPVLTDVMIDVGGYEEKIVKEVSVLDNKMAAAVMDSMFNSTDQYFMVSWDLKSKEEVWRVRRFLHSLRGKQKPFWLPTQTRDMTLTAAVDPSATGIKVKKFGGSLFYHTKDIQILQADCTRTFHSVEGIADDGLDENLTLSSSAGITVAVAQNPKISFMYKVRLDVDRVEINYQTSSHVTIRVPVKEVEN